MSGFTGTTPLIGCNLLKDINGLGCTFSSGTTCSDGGCIGAPSTVTSDADC